jgi:hypothetical protein
MSVDDERLLAFLGPQLRDYGGKVAIDTDLWVLFAVGTTDEESNKLARWLLDGAFFENDAGPSEDDRWILYYVNTADREEAVHWLDVLTKVASGQIRPTSPTQRSLIRELGGSGMPHRVAQKLAEQHARGDLSAGSVQEPLVMRALLDRLSGREPLFFSALQTLLSNHLIDLIVLVQQLIAENLSLGDEIGRGTRSRDPFQRLGQLAADDILSLLIRFQIINPFDHGSNTIITNPYAAYMEIIRKDGQIMAHVDGNAIALPREGFVEAIRSSRRNLYRDSSFSNFDTQAPWMRGKTADSFRLIKQRLESRRDLSAMDGLYMLERAAED